MRAEMQPIRYIKRGTIALMVPLAFLAGVQLTPAKATESATEGNGSDSFGVPAELNWNGDAGGPGTWSTTAVNWFDPESDITRSWPGPPTQAVFAGQQAGTVSVRSAITVLDMSFDDPVHSGYYTLQADPEYGGYLQIARGGQTASIVGENLPKLAELKVDIVDAPAALSSNVVSNIEISKGIKYIGEKQYFGNTTILAGGFLQLGDENGIGGFSGNVDFATTTSIYDAPRLSIFYDGNTQFNTRLSGQPTNSAVGLTCTDQDADSTIVNYTSDNSTANGSTLVSNCNLEVDGKIGGNVYGMDIMTGNLRPFSLSGEGSSASFKTA
nr:hypothetical protein [Marinicella sp. W31]MDC2876169.1 hypothetical protein [Marinicella sp. W31]